MIMQKFVMWLALSGLAVLIPACALMWLHEKGIHPLRDLVGRFRNLNPISRLLVCAFAFVLVVHGSTKPHVPPQDGGSGGTGASEQGGDGESCGGCGCGTEPCGGLSGAEDASGHGNGGSRGDGSNPEDRMLAFAPETGFTPEQIAQGFVVTELRTGEAFDFSPPEGAHAVDAWRLRGAASDMTELGGPSNGSRTGSEDGVIDPSWIVTTDGRIMDGRRDAIWVFAPLQASLAVVPEANWSCLPNGLTESCVWWQERTGSFVVTWENLLAERETNGVVCVQAEFFEDGRFVYRYGSHPAHVAAAAQAGAARFGCGETIDLSADPSVSSVWFHRLEAEDAWETDRDGDGLSTYDEIFLHRTNPGAVDSDGDGMSDGEEIGLGQDPLVRNVSDAVLQDRLAAAMTNEEFAVEQEVVRDQLTARKLWEGFAFTADVSVTNVLFERTFAIDTRLGCQSYFLSARPDSAHGWSLEGMRLEWSDDLGTSGVVRRSPHGDSLRLTVSEGATEVVLRLVAEDALVRSVQPMWLLGYTPRFDVQGGQEVSLPDGGTAFVYVDLEKDRPIVNIDWSIRPCHATLSTEEISSTQVIPPVEPGVWPVHPWVRSRSAGAGDAQGGAWWYVLLDPSVSYGNDHGFLPFAVTEEDGVLRRQSAYPIDSSSLWERWWQDAAGNLRCSCQPEVSSGVGESPIVTAFITGYDGVSATGAIHVASTQVWEGVARHSISSRQERDPSSCGCPSSCRKCRGKVDGASAGSIRFRISLGEIAGGLESGFAWFRSEGPVSVSPEVFDFSIRPDAPVTVLTNGSDRIVSCSTAGGRDIAFTAVANGVTISVCGHGQEAPSEAWSIANVDGEGDRIRIVRAVEGDAVAEDWTYSCTEMDDGGWTWTFLDNLTGAYVVRETFDDLNSVGSYRVVENRYEADGEWLGREETLEELLCEDGQATLVSSSSASTSVEVDARGKRIVRTVTKYADRTVTDETVTGPDVPSVLHTVETVYSGGRRVILTESDGLSREETSWLEDGESADDDTDDADGEGAVAEEQDAVYDADGLLASCGPTNFTYNAYGDLCGISVVEGGVESFSRTFAYDSWGRLVSVSDSDGSTLTLAYDGMGNVVSMTSPDGTLRATYDGWGARLSLDASEWRGELPIDESEESRSGMSCARSMPRVEHLTAWRCLQHYRGGSGEALAMSFSEIDTSDISPWSFKSFRDFVSDCHLPDSYKVEGHRVISTKGNQQWFLGQVTIRLKGIVTWNRGCSWTFRGILSCAPDKYDFDRASRGIGVETLTAIGRFFFSGRPYKIHFIGTKAISASGNECGPF